MVTRSFVDYEDSICLQSIDVNDLVWVMTSCEYVEQRKCAASIMQYTCELAIVDDINEEEYKHFRMEQMNEVEEDRKAGRLSKDENAWFSYKYYSELYQLKHPVHLPNKPVWERYSYIHFIDDYRTIKVRFARNPSVPVEIEMSLIICNWTEKLIDHYKKTWAAIQLQRAYLKRYWHPDNPCVLHRITKGVWNNNIRTQT